MCAKLTIMSVSCPVVDASGLTLLCAAFTIMGPEVGASGMALLRAAISVSWLDLK